MTLRALTLQQPWAWAITHAGKRIENRGWKPPPSLIGSWLAIHAGKVLDDDAQMDLLLRGMNGRAIQPPEQHVHGAIVAVARVVDCVTESDSEWFCGPFGWVLDDVTAIDPVPCRGAQGLWTVPDDMLAIVRERWKAVRQ